MDAAIDIEGLSKSLSGRQESTRGLLLLAVWGILFFASYYLPLVGVSVNYYPLIFVALIVLLGAGAWLCSLGLTKEKVVLSSKG